MTIDFNRRDRHPRWASVKILRSPAEPSGVSTERPESDFGCDGGSNGFEQLTGNL